ncbi:MAG: DUF4175 domain-containing protein [Sphingomonas taxi]
MSGDPLVGRWTRATRLRSACDDAAIGVPLVVAVAAIGWRLGGWAVAAAVSALGLVVLALAIRWRTRRFGERWLIARLDAAHRDLEDSSDLLFRDAAALTPLQRIQQARVRQRIEAAPVAPLIAARDPGWLAGVALLAVACLAAAWLWPHRREIALAPAAEGLRTIPGVPRLVAQALEVTPPAYTGLPPRTLASLDARVPAGSTLRWTLRFAPDPRGAQLATIGRPPIALARDGGDWQATAQADRALLYRVVPADAARAGVPPLHRIDVVVDRPPQVRVTAPRDGLTLLAAGQRGAEVAFLATDDYGVRATARLRIVVAQGAGENVRFAERTLTLAGSGPPRARRFAARLDFAGLGFTEPGDVVAQLTVADTRMPVAQAVRGPSVILRRPAAVAQGSGLEAMTRRVMPAYFRSQRQIIIDAEALLAERPRPAADGFLARSDAIGADQRLLRLRYGQFMGEETGGGATSAMPTNDDEDAPAAPAPDAHDHAGEAPAKEAPTFGAAQDVTAEYGHVHDEAEAATLLDPGTRATLRQALDAMWLSETALRQGQPRAALPHAYRALRFIKQVQQATRIFLARTGSDLPPVNLSRRMTGTRGAMGARDLPSAAAEPVDPEPAAIWRTLDGAQHAAALDAAARWLARNGDRVPDPLALAGAIDTLRRRPGCEPCRAALRGALWQALPRPAAGMARRDAGDAVGRRYLDALP